MYFSQNKRSGILLHPTALPSSHGIGDIGPEAYKFVDLLFNTGQSMWQVLPLGPTDYSNSPYSSLSTFAGNHLLISFDLLESDGLLDSKYLIVNQPNSNKVNFKEVKNFKLPILKMVAKNFKNNASEEFLNAFDVFCEKEFYWLNDYSKYYALKEQNNDENWFNWKSDVIVDLAKVEEAKVLQFLFHYQWNILHKYCNSKGVQIIGDMPIYVSYNSSDVFFNKNLFELNTNSTPFGLASLLHQSMFKKFEPEDTFNIKNGFTCSTKETLPFVCFNPCNNPLLLFSIIVGLCSSVEPPNSCRSND